MDYDMEFDPKRLDNNSLINLYVEYTGNTFSVNEREGHGASDGYISRMITKEQFLEIIEMLDVNRENKEE